MSKNKKVTIIAIIWISIEAHYRQKTPNSEAELAIAYLTATNKQKEQLDTLYKNLKTESDNITNGKTTTQQISTYTINFLFYLTIHFLLQFCQTSLRQIF